MPAHYDEQGNYIYPEGFDPETNEWLPGHEEQQAEWERQYAEARARFEAHQTQIAEAQKADAAAAGEEGAASGAISSSSAGAEEPQGSLASDAQLEELRRKLTSGEG